MQSVTILPGRDKTGKPEPFQGITLERGELCTIVGNTGSGKSRFIKDVEQLAHGDSVTRRRVLLDGVEIPAERRQSLSSQLVAHLGQNMRFVLDASVEEFLALHAQCRGKETPPVEVLALANEITPEPVALGQSLNLGEVVADVRRALHPGPVCDGPLGAGCLEPVRVASLTRSRTPASTKSGRWACFSVMTSWCWWSPMTRTPP